MPQDDIPKLPPGLAKRDLHFFILADCSGSMLDKGRIQSLNEAMREALPHMKEAAAKNEKANFYLRVLKFSNGAQWHVEKASVADFAWTDLTAEENALTNLGIALRMIADELRSSSMPKKALPPILLLLSDGVPTDDWEGGLKILLDHPWGKKTVRIAIAIGPDPDMEVLSKFMGRSGGELKPLQARNPEQLVSLIRWVTVSVSDSVSKPQSQPWVGEKKPSDQEVVVNVGTPPPLDDKPSSWVF